MFLTATYRYVYNASTGSVGHGGDMGSVWGGSQSSALATELGRVIQGAWAKFVKNPAEGPGWARLGSTDKALADLGGEGDRKSITMISPNIVDARCPLFYDAYDPNRPR